MLILKRRLGEAIQIGEATVRVLERSGDVIKLGITAPREVRIIREELIDDASGKADGAALVGGVKVPGDLRVH